MGFLEKRNPKATRESVVVAAVGGALAFSVIGSVLWLASDMPWTAGFLLVPWMGLCGAVTGGAMEWQMPGDE